MWKQHLIRTRAPGCILPASGTCKPVGCPYKTSMLIFVALVWCLMDNVAGMEGPVGCLGSCYSWHDPKQYVTPETY
jgi:hypothetical protein